jgi:hypothetical protein
MSPSREIVEKRKNQIINDLIAAGYTKHADGRQLYELSIPELEQLNIEMRIKKCRSIPVNQVTT